MGLAGAGEVARAEQALLLGGREQDHHAASRAGALGKVGLRPECTA